ncbi:hypothetical protein [Pedobacter steynii]|uniref:Uncharacterized protein n=1 Tax=Pedobacter steynii TaxID=430522 RepID=A0A1D7QMZ0_9SPHI|nr:hypothetical protein [Pedobacter steynii]AOM80028.1 hypothetical protein BFS30_24420 [Pedobacter steynii]
MEIEIKRISFNPRIDAQSFAANLVVDGVKAGNIVSNSAGTQYYPVNENGQALIEKAEKFCEKLPAKTITVDGKPQEVKQNLPAFIGDLFATHLQTLEKIKYDKKVDIAMKQNIVIGEPLKYIRTVPTKSPISLLAQTTKGQEFLSEIISRQVLPGLSANEKLLNTNISEDILKAAGLKQDQYVRRADIHQELPKQQTKKQGRKI